MALLKQRKLAMTIAGVGILLTLLNGQTVHAWTLWYVAPGGNNDWDCLSVATACRTIQAAINRAAVADSVRVEAGTYSAATNGEIFPIVIAKSLTVFGAGSATTIVNAAGSGTHVFSAAGNNISVNLFSFTLQGGNRAVEHIGYYPGHITGQIAHNRITGNTVGIYTNTSQGEILRNDVSGNTNHGIYNEASSPVVKQNIVGWNGSGGTSAAIYNVNSHPNIINNIIGWNNGSGVYNTGSNPSITNNTISFNFGGSGVGNFSSSNPEVANNIITSNGVYGIHADETSVPSNAHNDVWANAWANYHGPAGGAGSISQDPRFASWFDAHLLCSSPAINRGSNVAPQVPAIDYDGNPRPIGGTVDMGAIERQTDLYCPILLPVLRR